MSNVLVNGVFIGLDILNWTILLYYYVWSIMYGPFLCNYICGGAILLFSIAAFLGLEAFGTIKKNLYAMIGACVFMYIRFLIFSILDYFVSQVTGPFEPGYINIYSVFLFYLTVLPLLRIILQGIFIYEIVYGNHSEKACLIPPKSGYKSGYILV